MHQIIASLVQVVASGEIARYILTTLMRFLTGSLIAAMIAVSLGILLGYSPFGHSLLETLMEFLRPMPSVAIIPVAILLLGIGDGMIVGVTVYASLWPILINTIDGVKQIDPVLVQTGRVFGLGPWRLLRCVILPAASPSIVTGLRISLAIALIVVTTAEMIAGGILADTRYFQVLEHTIATHLLDAGAALRCVHHGVGHASITNTLIDAQRTSHRRDEAARKIFAS